MHPMIVECIKRLDNHLEKNALNKNEIELKKVMSNLTMDVIASCAFGTRIDTYNDEHKSEFLINAQKVFKFNFSFLCSMIIMNIFPKITDWIAIPSFNPSATHFFTSAVSLLNRK